VRGLALGVFLTLFLIFVGGYLLIHSGKVSMSTDAPSLPFESTLAHMALHASIGTAADDKDPVAPDEGNMAAGVVVYKQHCAVCHGIPGQPPTAIAQGMYPPPPQLFDKKDMVTDDPEGVTFWKVTHGIRLTGMPGFQGTLSNTQRWQVTLLLAHADKLPHAAQVAFGH
jgi:thiosulfate dehydrogenase